MQEQNVWGGWLISNAYVGIKRSSKQSGAGASTFRRRLGVCSPTLLCPRLQTRTLNWLLTTIRISEVNFIPEQHFYKELLTTTLLRNCGIATERSQELLPYYGKVDLYSQHKFVCIKQFKSLFQVLAVSNWHD